MGERARDGGLVLITGGAGGIGGAISRRFAAEGYEVVVGDVDGERGEALADEVGGEYVHCDCGDLESMKDTVAGIGRVDVLVNNVGVRGETGAVWEIPIGDFARTFELNTLSHIYMSQLVAPGMIERRQGAIVNIASGAARTGAPGRAPYGISKWAVLGTTKSFANELAPWGIRVNAVLPGIVAGERFEGSIAIHAESEGITREEAFDRIMSRTRLKRSIDPAEIAGAVWYLAGPDGVGVTGTFLDVSGGFE